MQSRSLQQEIGLVRATKHYLASIEGLPSVRVHDIVYTEEGGRALVTALSHDAIEVIVLDPIDIRPGQRFVVKSRESNHLSIGDYLFGRVINALGDPVDGKGGFPPKNAPIILEQDSGDLARRAPITTQLQTGFSMVDTVLPIGKGQRQLLMGPIQSGIDVFCRQLIRNQEGKNTVCIYATIGKPVAYIRRMAELLLADASQKYTIVIASTAQDLAPLNAMTPSVATYIAEYFCEQGKDVILILDDLYTHAKYLREISLLEGRLPGRESYPGDIFYQQAHLMERAGNFAGKGSITLLPVLQTDIDVSTDLIMTNVMGTTDGHLSFSPTLFAQGVFPPILEEQSVTRVGKHTQSVLQKQMSTAIMSLLAETREQERFMQFGSQVSDATRTTIDMGHHVSDLLDQPETGRLSVETQVLLFGLIFTSFSTDKKPGFFAQYRDRLCVAIEESSELAGIREKVCSDLTFDEMVRLLEKQIPLFAKVCQK
jgi:F-type H+/Na+-transporting ATPase subunit alpha